MGMISLNFNEEEEEFIYTKSH